MDFEHRWFLVFPASLISHVSCVGTFRNLLTHAWPHNMPSLGKCNLSHNRNFDANMHLFDFYGARSRFLWNTRYQKSRKCQIRNAIALKRFQNIQLNGLRVFGGARLFKKWTGGGRSGERLRVFYRILPGKGCDFITYALWRRPDDNRLKPARSAEYRKYGCFKSVLVNMLKW